MESLYALSNNDIISNLGKRYAEYRKRMGYTQKEINMETNAIKVTLWGEDVGYLYWDKKEKCAVLI